MGSRDYPLLFESVQVVDKESRPTPVGRSLIRCPEASRGPTSDLLLLRRRSSGPR